jgi:hypothetical protein
MMEERRRLLTPKESRDPDLSAGGREKVDTANDVIHTLLPVINRNGELIRPVAVTIAQQHVAALLFRILALASKPPIVELLNARIDPKTPAITVDQRKLFVSTEARVPQFRRLIDWGRNAVSGEACDAAGTVARIEESLLAQPIQRFTVDVIAIALSPVAPARPIGVGRKNIGTVFEPVEIVENASFEEFSRSSAIVILDSQKDLSA